MSDKSRVRKTITIWGLLFLFALFLPVIFTGQHHEEDPVISEKDQQEMAEADFEAGEMIIDHITDAYEWHIITIGQTHVSIYLPVILYDEGEWRFFM